MSQIEALYAWVAEDGAGAGQEGIVAVMAPNGSWLPLVSHDRPTMEALKVPAQRVATETGKPVRLVSFEFRVDHDEVLEP